MFAISFSNRPGVRFGRGRGRGREQNLDPGAGIPVKPGLFASFWLSRRRGRGREWENLNLNPGAGARDGKNLDPGAGIPAKPGSRSDTICFLSGHFHIFVRPLSPSIFAILAIDSLAIFTIMSKVANLFLPFLPPIFLPFCSFCHLWVTLGQYGSHRAAYISCLLLLARLLSQHLYTAPVPAPAYSSCPVSCIQLVS